MRLHRFWGVHYRKLGSPAHLPPADQRRQVMEKKAISETIPGTTFDPTSGGQNEAPQLAFGLQKRLGRYPKVGPETGPQLGGQELVPKYVMEW